MTSLHESVNMKKINSGTQTVDVEIKTVRALTERPEAEKGWKSRLLNGPRRAQGKDRRDRENSFRVFCDVGHTLVAADMMVS